MKIKFWKGPSHLNKLLMRGWIIAGIGGMIFGLWFKDKGLIILSLGIAIIGGAIYGFQSLAWKQWEEQHKP